MPVVLIPITKAGNKTIEVDTDKIPDEIFSLALAEGLKVMLNSKMTKITTAKLEGEELAKAQSDAMAKAQENLEAILAGKFTKGRASSTPKGISGEVMVEARRLAKAKVKDLLKAAGLKVSHVEAKEITEAANQLISADPSYIDQAKANIEARKAKTVDIDITSLIHESPKLVAKAEAEKVARAAVLSAKQAGTAKVAPRKVQPSA